jgi:hypothetical protein
MNRNTDELIEEISDFLVVYLKSGKVNLNSFIRKAHLNIRELEQLINIHFLLKDEVKGFVRELPRLVRRFKTSTTVFNETYHGQVRGQIHWQNTVKERLKSGYRDRTIFSCNEQSRNYNIKENLVLKSFVHLLDQLLNRKIESAKFMKYAWFSEWQELKQYVEEVLHKNIYMQRVSLDGVRITDRMLLETAKHRNPLYSEAAKLYILYRRLHAKKLNEEEIQKLLQQTFVTPDESSVLFELYWAVQLIKQNGNNVKLELLDGRKNLFASWSDVQYKYELYHDSTGSKNLLFHIGVEEASEIFHPFIERKVASMAKASAVSTHAFGSSFDQGSLWNGRPDLLVEVYKKDTAELVKVVIGEVKHTSKIEYAKIGLRELVDYMKFIKVSSGHYLTDQKNIEIQGMLFLDNVYVKQTEYEDIRIVNHLNNSVSVN